MENIEELEERVLEIVREKYKRTGGHNGNFFRDFDHILNMSIEETIAFLLRMEAEKKIKIYQGANSRLITLPK
ncbi:hypothetical protein BA768_01105 [Chryseobacterium sp. CBo1]|uniref:hypothetical protein n=1 Tax=Chryseobacterium sp. CBo1 TaxID=1869230 RepID=UPI000810D6F3|nr:hypothetical protein [Chryseobacterium sp. CBo1]OCK53182.1 hypothetical protein BA768_01105 [Chryseobacterium sp. CBo1]